MNPKVDFYFSKESPWQEELIQLRRIALDCGLNEELKWGCPCYTLTPSTSNKKKSNVVLIHAFKEYCAFLLFKGALLNDPKEILIQQTENVQSARQIRFTSAHQILEQEALLKTTIFEAIEVEKAGLKVELKKTKDYEVPEEFQQKLEELPALKTAFETLTPGRQRAYLFYFLQAKQSKTRQARIEKCMQPIFDGKGLNE